MSKYPTTDRIFNTLNGLAVSVFEKLQAVEDTIVDWYNTAWAKLERRLPRLIWYGDEVDVLITFTKTKLDMPTNTSEIEAYLASTQQTAEQAVQAQFPPDALAEAVAKIKETGIEFDTGLSWRGRDLYFDYSLKGPVRVKFIGRAKKPADRLE